MFTAGPAPLAEQDNRRCGRRPVPPAAVRPAEGVYDFKPLVQSYDDLKRAYDACARLQARNLEVLRGERAKP